MRESLSSGMSEAALEVLRRRAASLATEQSEEVADDRVGLLAFQLGPEWYAVSVESVREIYNEYRVTRIPCVPSFIRGVINIRGEIISVTDIASLMGTAGTPDSGEGCAIVIQNDECVTAMVVNAIADIVEVPREAIEPPLSTIDKGQAEFVTGSVFLDGRLVAVLNTEKVLEPIGASA